MLRRDHVCLRFACADGSQRGGQAGLPLQRHLEDFFILDATLDELILKRWVEHLKPPIITLYGCNYV